MAQASKKTKAAEPLSGQLLRNIKEIGFIFLGLVALYLAVSLYSYHPEDPGWSQAVSTHFIHNKGGLVGAWIDFRLSSPSTAGACSGPAACNNPSIISISACGYWACWSCS